MWLNVIRLGGTDVELEQARARTFKHLHQVYVLVHPAFPAYVKIGKTVGRAGVRLSTFNIGCPHKAYSFAAVVPVANAHAAEARLHAALAPRRAEGEWFRVHPKLAVALAEALRKGRPYHAKVTPT